MIASASAPALWPVAAVVLDAMRSPHSRRAYRRAIEGYLAWLGLDTMDRASVARYCAGLREAGAADATVDLALAALRRLAVEAQYAGVIDSTVALGVRDLRGSKRLGRRTGNWLDRDTARRLLESPDGRTLIGQRDRLLLALLLTGGLRRDEVAGLRLEQVQLREARWVLVDVRGKGQRLRTVPIPAWVALWAQQWAVRAGLTAGRILRPICGGHVAGDGLAPKAIYRRVRRYAAKLGIDLAPHDLRRTFAMLARAGGADIEQIQLTLGHSSVVTTERYLGGKLDLHNAACDHLGALIEPAGAGLDSTVAAAMGSRDVLE